MPTPSSDALPGNRRRRREARPVRTPLDRVRGKAFKGIVSGSTVIPLARVVKNLHDRDASEADSFDLKTYGDPQGRRRAREQRVAQR